MRQALKEAKKAQMNGDVPVGAVLVKNGKIISRGRNKREFSSDPTAHAEVEALARAGRKLKEWNLCDCELFVTLEPCCMCSGAVVNARIKRVVFGAYDKRFGCGGTVFNLMDEERFNHRAEVVGGVLQDECSRILSDFFKELRKKSDEEKPLK